jgi:hypothetical protein
MNVTVVSVTGKMGQSIMNGLLGAAGFGRLYVIQAFLEKY